MLKVLVADDEVKILQLITHLVRWEDYGMEVVATATDGNQAYLAISEYEPDVVITDIRMPNISGVELVEKTIGLGLKPYFVIVSGYSDFSYAQKAIKLGVEDYLLKPLKRKDLDGVLRKIQEKEGVEAAQQQEKKALTRALTRMQGKLKDNILTDLIVRKQSNIQRLGGQEILDEYGVSFTGKSFATLILHLYPEVVDSPDTTREEEEFVLPKLQKEVRRRMEPVCREYVSIIRGQEILCLLNFDPGSVLTIEEQLNKLRINIMEYRTIYPQMQVIAALGPTFTSFADAEKGFDGALEMLKRRSEQKGHFLLTYRKPSFGSMSPVKLITLSERSAIRQLIETMNEKELSDQLTSIGEKLKPHQDKGLLLYQCYDVIADLFLAGVSSHLSSEDRQALHDKIYGFPELVSDFNTAYSCMKKTCLDTLSQISSSKQDGEHLPIRRAKDYINENFGMAITLESVAHETGFNPAYFSSLFKKETGLNFSEYLTEVRMENAKIMLRQSNRDIADIAIACGYNDIKYFSRLFKKAVKITPSEYRKLYG